MLLCKTFFGQKTLNKIDSLNSESAVFALVKYQMPEYQGNGVFETYYGKRQKIADSLNIQNWIKTDIDNNGETDLLVFNAYRLPKIFAILSFSNKLVNISARYACNSYILYPVLGVLHNQKVIYIYKGEDSDYNTRFKHLTCDTLVVKEDAFLNYVDSPKGNDIESVKIYNDGMCEGNCPIINIEIDAKTYANKCSKQMYQWYIDRKPENSSGQLTELQIKKILSLLAYSNFTELKDNYSAACTDQTTTTMKITYGGGKTKIIKDYGSSGNFTLHEIYRLASNIEWAIEK